MTRKRDCIQTNPEIYGDRNCTGESAELQECYPGECPIGKKTRVNSIHLVPSTKIHNSLNKYV
jgi:hypothetical protein